MIYLQNGSYNIEVAKVFGINPAILLTCIDTEYYYQMRNNKLSDNNTMVLSRAEIYERTALDDSQQIDAEISLQECGILLIKPVQNSSTKNYYILNDEQLDKIINSDNPAEILSFEKANQFIKGKRKEPLSRRQTHINNLKKKIKVEDPIVQQYFVDWIDSIYSNQKGFLSTSGVVCAQQELMEYSKGNQNIQIKVLQEAINGSLREMEWAIKRYEKNNGIDSRNFAAYQDIKTDYSMEDSDEVF